MMKPKQFIKAASAAAILTAGMFGCQSGGDTPMGYKFPQDVMVSCPLDSDTLSTWFVGGSIVSGSAVNPANSVNFVHDSNCNFYRWAEQMFLWITSPVPGGGGTTMESPVFYTVQPDTNNNGSQRRILIKHTPGTTLKVTSKMKKNAIGRPRLFRDAHGNTSKIGTETGQATNDILVAQNGSLVYYILFVNDMYAYYNAGTAAKVSGLNDTLFPTTAAEAHTIDSLAYATDSTHLTDTNALVMELKTSWVEVNSLLANPESYIQVDAIIPTYDTIAPGQWMLKGERKARLAMIGMHVVGSTAGHPEMVWATFEHIDNAPNAQYYYLNNKGETVFVPQDTGKRWLLSNNAADPNPNVSQQHWSDNTDPTGVIPDTVYSANPNARTMVPSNTLRTMSWGMDTTKASAVSNSQVISLNNAISKLLPSGDVRKNYFLVGSTWTDNGAAPNGATNAGDKGTNCVANSTMETYFEANTNTCFSCHSGFVAITNNPDTISHIFANIVPIPLTKAPASINKKK